MLPHKCQSSVWYCVRTYDNGDMVLGDMVLCHGSCYFTNHKASEVVERP